MLRRLRNVAAMPLIVAAFLGGCAQSESPKVAVDASPPLAVFGSTATVEIAPVLLAARYQFGHGGAVRNGGIGNLVGVVRDGGFGGSGVADVATHAETQALRYSVANPGVRIILTVTEGHYRIVARRSAGISRVSDLKGKRIATLATTSSGYFLARMLEREGLSFADVVPVRISPLEDIAGAIERREVDAVAMWEPFAGNAMRVLGDDAIEFPGRGVYRELFNLNSTAANLADPAKRKRIVRFVRAVIDVSKTLKTAPDAGQALVAATSGFSPGEVSRSWPYLSFPASLSDDLLDTLVEEEKWLAQQERREPRSREILSGLIDRSIYEEAIAL